MNYINILEKYNFQELEYGKNDCNIQFLECFEPNIYKEILGRYKTELGGARKAKQLCGYMSIKELVLDNPNIYKPIDVNFVRYGDFFVNNHHIAICLGDKTFAYVDGHFRVVDTKIFTDDVKFKPYRKDI
ncbi:hypothetical protein VPDG_00124 [Vibrio phage henriette 12B8]|uniref:hypothetical protein n=1 Tax=Vibrio phage henriette 12B8 TaxID=573174 RepID=UPI0002C0BE5A|nr:hypothetical protein VPDG_00124 [Vibrio phage henriette 12B8]AGG58285.1 hypothetical protein VPDG_00124 [Vibrio phage henriette 12B8]